MTPQRMESTRQKMMVMCALSWFWFLSFLWEEIVHSVWRHARQDVGKCRIGYMENPGFECSRRGEENSWTHCAWVWPLNIAMWLSVSADYNHKCDTIVSASIYAYKRLALSITGRYKLNKTVNWQPIIILEQQSTLLFFGLLVVLQFLVTLVEKETVFNPFTMKDVYIRPRVCTPVPEDVYIRPDIITRTNIFVTLLFLNQFS